MASPLLSSDPRQLGSYWLAGRLGAGGQGVVYEGYDGSGVRVAVKTLHGDFVVGPHRDQFRKEVEALGRVASFCTARIIETDLDHLPPYLVSEYVPGPDLQSWVDRNGAYEAADLFRLAIGIATALTSIHQAGVVHRDMKPANVLLGPDGPRVIDFGIARTEEMSRSATGVIKGTPRWMAPEAFLGQRATPAVDVWAWGAIVLFAATGKPPFDGESWPSLSYQVLNHEPELDPLTEPLRSLVERALSKEPERRPSSRDLLEGLIGGEARETPLEAGKRAAGVLPGTAIPPSLAEVAEDAFGRLAPVAQATVPRVLLRMTAAASDAQHILRNVGYEEFLDGETSEHTIRRILDVLRQAGLVVHDGDAFTLASPALVRAWPRLREWVEQDHAVLGLHHDLADAARLWNQNGRKRSDLLQGSTLEGAMAWAMAARRHITVNLLERTFLDGSVAAARRRRRNRALLSMTMAVLLVIATGTAAFAIVQGRGLASQNHVISRQRDQAVGARIANLATSMRTVDPVTAKRLAIASATLAPGGIDGRSALVTLYNQTEQSTFLPPGVDGSWAVAADGAGQHLAYAHANGHEVEIVDVDARKVIRAFTVPGATVADNSFTSHKLVSLTSDGRYLSVLHSDGTVDIWDTTTGRPQPVTFKSPGPYAALSPTGDQLLGMGAKQTVVWDVRTGKQLLTIPHGMTTAAFLPHQVLVGANGASLELWDIGKGKQLPSPPSLGLGKGEIQDVAASPMGMIGVWRRGQHGNDPDKLELLHADNALIDIRTITTQGNGSVNFSADGKYVVLNSTVWDTTNFQALPVLQYTGSIDGHTAQTFGPGDDTLRGVDNDATVNVLSLSSIVDSLTLPDQLPDPVLSRDGSTLIVQDQKELQVWDPVKRTKQGAIPISSDTNYLSQYTLSNDGRLLANATTNWTVEIWDTRTGTKKLTLSPPHAATSTSPSVAFSPDDRTLAVLAPAGNNTTWLQLWDLASGTRRATSTGDPTGIPAVVTGLELAGSGVKIQFSADGRTVMSSTDQGVVDVATGRRLTQPNHQANPVAALSRTGLLAVDHTGKVVLFDGRTLQPKYSFNPGKAIGLSAAFSPDGQILATDDALGEIRLWDVASRHPFGIPLTSVYAPDTNDAANYTKTMAFTADGSMLLGVDNRNRLRSNLISPEKITKDLCAQVGSLSPADWKTYIPELPYRRTC